MFVIELPTICIFFYQNIFNFVAQLFQKTGAGGGNRRRPPPLNPQKFLDGQSCWPANSLQEYPKIMILAIIMPEI